MICSARLLTSQTVDSILYHYDPSPSLLVQPRRQWNCQGATCIHESFDVETAEVKVCGKPVLMVGKHAWLCATHYNKQQGERHDRSEVRHS